MCSSLGQARSRPQVSSRNNGSTVLLTQSPQRIISRYNSQPSVRTSCKSKYTVSVPPVRRHTESRFASPLLSFSFLLISALHFDRGDFIPSREVLWGLGYLVGNGIQTGRPNPANPCLIRDDRLESELPTDLPVLLQRVALSTRSDHVNPKVLEVGNLVCKTSEGER